MKSIDKVSLILSVIMEVLLAADIVIAITTQKVSVLSFVCVALIAMLEIGCNLFVSHQCRKNKKK